MIEGLDWYSCGCVVVEFQRVGEATEKVSRRSLNSIGWGTGNFTNFKPTAPRADTK